MGQAKNKGSFEERKKAAIKEGRVKEIKEKNNKSDPSFNPLRDARVYKDPLMISNKKRTVGKS